MHVAHRMPAPLDAAGRRRHKWRNRLQSAILLGGMIALLTFCIWLLFGRAGALWALVGWGIGLLLAPGVSPRLVLRLYDATPLRPDEFPAGYEAVRVLARRAGLSHPPTLHYIATPVMNAFAVGDRREAAIAITGGMLRALDLRELAAVLAHEISHIRNNDLWVMAMADSISRMTNLLALVGFGIVAFALPGLLMGVAHPSVLLAGGMLMLAPTVSSLLQMGLSRAREYDADLDAAGLTGDPAGLASALAKLERYQGRVWERLLMPGRRVPDPSLLRTHPPTEERIRRLLALAAAPQSQPFRAAVPLTLPPHARSATLQPRWRLLGHWY